MRQLAFWTLILLSLISCRNIPEKNHEKIRKTEKQLPDTTDMTNNFYDNTETLNLPVGEITIEGEIANPGKVDLQNLPLRSVIVKETLLDSAGGDKFIGAYRYDGYSLFDILNDRILKKANSDFSPIIDVYVEIENEKGEKAVFSWGEIYYPNNLHKIIIASKVSRIVPSKTKEKWPLPVTGKIVAGADLITERNISNPIKITVRSYSLSLAVNRNLSPLYSKQIDLFSSGGKTGTIDKISEKANTETFNTVFYGRGKGIHSTTPFKGVLLKDILKVYYPVSQENLRSGLLCLAGKDGYRCVVSYSELFNRNDQQEFLLVKTDPGEDGGLFRIFAAPDFFSDRAIKSLMQIRMK